MCEIYTHTNISVKGQYWPITYSSGTDIYWAWVLISSISSLHVQTIGCTLYTNMDRQIKDAVCIFHIWIVHYHCKCHITVDCDDTFHSKQNNRNWCCYKHAAMWEFSSSTAREIRKFHSSRFLYYTSNITWRWNYEICRQEYMSKKELYNVILLGHYDSSIDNIFKVSWKSDTVYLYNSFSDYKIDKKGSVCVCPDLRTVCLLLTRLLRRKLQLGPSMLHMRPQCCVSDTRDSW